jgi:Flp pilus assembly protein TadG
MALLLPLLVLILGGIIDFGLMLNAQVSLTHAAREGVRIEAIGSADDPVAAATSAFRAPAATNFTASIPSGRECPNPEGALMEVSATYRYFILPLGQIQLENEAVMRCGG